MSLRFVEPSYVDARRRFVTAGKSVCLITPPSAFLLDERVFVSLGVLKVAAASRRTTITSISSICPASRIFSRRLRII